MLIPTPLPALLAVTPEEGTEFVADKDALMIEFTVLLEFTVPEIAVLIAVDAAVEVKGKLLDASELAA